jgi:hypothetical protein
LGGRAFTTVADSALRTVRPETDRWRSHASDLWRGLPQARFELAPSLALFAGSIPLKSRDTVPIARRWVRVPDHSGSTHG